MEKFKGKDDGISGRRFSSVIRANKCMSDVVGSTVKLGDHIRDEKGNERRRIRRYSGGKLKEPRRKREYFNVSLIYGGS